MANTPTPNVALQKPAQGDTPWDSTINGNWDRLDQIFGGTVTPPNMNITAATIATATIATLRATLLSQYNNIATAGLGLAAISAVVDLLAQNAAIATATLYNVTATGQYRLSWNAKVTTAAGTSSTLGPLTIVYTDPDGVVQTITAAAQISAGTIATSSNGNTTTTVLIGMPLTLNVKANTVITYAMAYASNAANAMQYNLHIRLESF